MLIDRIGRFFKMIGESHMNIGWEYAELGFSDVRYALEYSTCTEGMKKLQNVIDSTFLSWHH